MPFTPVVIIKSCLMIREGTTFSATKQQDDTAYHVVFSYLFPLNRVVIIINFFFLKRSPSARMTSGEGRVGPQLPVWLEGSGATCFQDTSIPLNFHLRNTSSWSGHHKIVIMPWPQSLRKRSFLRTPPFLRWLALLFKTPLSFPPWNAQVESKLTPWVACVTMFHIFIYFPATRQNGCSELKPKERRWMSAAICFFPSLTS